MANQHVCDRCGKVIKDYDIEKHKVSIFNPEYKISGLLYQSGLIINIKCESVDLCEKCQEDLAHTMYLFMHKNGIK